MQDGASNKSDSSYLFGVFFLTEDIGNNVGLCWVCRILTSWSSYGLFCDRSKASSIVSFSESVSNFQYLLLSLWSSNSCLHLLLHLPHPFIFPSITLIITVFYFMFWLTMFLCFWSCTPHTIWLESASPHAVYLSVWESQSFRNLVPVCHWILFFSGRWEWGSMAYVHLLQLIICTTTCTICSIVCY